MRKLFYTVFVLLLATMLTGISGARSSSAFELTPYARFGSIKLVEEEIEKGSKFLTALGLDATIGESLKGMFSAEIWQMSEPLDENIETIQSGRHLSAGVSYLIDKGLSFYPFASISYGKWSRNENPEHENRFGHFQYLSGNLGLGVKYNIFYARIGGLVPFWSKTDHGQSPGGKIGFDVTAGIELLERVKVSLFYERTRFGADGDQPDCQLNRSGLMVGIKF